VKRTNHENLRGPITCHVRGPKKALSSSLTMAKPWSWNLYKWPCKLENWFYNPEQGCRFGPKNQATKPWVSPIFGKKALLFGMNHLLVPALFQARGGIEGVYP